MWTRSDDCGKIIKEQWDKEEATAGLVGLRKKCEKVGIALSRWNWATFGHIQRRITALREKLSVSQAYTTSAAGLEVEESPKVGDEEVNKVADLILEDEGRWDVQKVQRILLWDAEQVEKIPLATKEADDVLVWHFSKDRKYNVKSGYYVEHLSRSRGVGVLVSQTR
ncbi:hypothetical protein U1Q18_019732 [Sarracenia purpurea var. burkii]